MGGIVTRVLLPVVSVFIALTCVACGSRTDLEIPDLDAGDAGDAGDAACMMTIDVLPRPVDLLFMIDNSNSMKDEQEALAAELPRLIEVLTTGDANGDGVQDFPAVPDLHLGVVSSDMGLPGVPSRQALACGSEGERPQGDDGVLLHQPNTGQNPNLSCARSYPSFLSFVSTRDQPDVVANDFACISALGTMGCGYEQQLESTLKALWPSDDRVAGRPVSLDRPFLAGRGQGAPDGFNTGFLRNSNDDGQSLIAVILVSDEDDCSSWATGHFVPDQFLSESDPMHGVPLNLRCSREGQRGSETRLHRVQRYIDGLRALRPGREDLVVFAAIVGVPPDLVTEERLRNVDFADVNQRRLFYSDVLADGRMIEVTDPETAMGNPMLLASCVLDRVNPITGESTRSKATPPLRIVQVAQGFGPSGIIQSICNDTFRPAIDGIISRLGDTFERPRCVR